jgi:protein TonB
MLDLKKNYKNKNESEKLLKKEKKHPKANLENYSKIFAQLGLVLSLLVVYILIQNKSYDKEVITMSLDFNRVIEDETSLFEYRIKPKPIPKKKIILKSIKKIDNETPIEETFIDVIDPNTPVEEPVFIPVDIVESITEEVPFILIEDVPVFPGCKGTNKEKRECFAKKIGKFVNRKFDASLAPELGLSPGIKRIVTIFKIDKNGNVIDIQARAPHKRLKDEAIRVIKLLPKMEPGKQRGNAVTVKYSLPIAFKIQ